VLEIFVCREVEGVFYLQADFDFQCYDERWNINAVFGAFFVLLYVVGTPVFFFTELYTYRYSKYGDRLHDKRVRARYGLLYDAYDRSVWYFEMLDMMHRLITTSIIIFLPWDMQMPVAMTAVVIHTVSLLWMAPYLRKSDDALHLVVQIEMLSVMLAGHIQMNVQADVFTDVLLTVSLVLIVGIMFSWFFRAVAKSVLNLYSVAETGFWARLRVFFGDDGEELPEKFDEARFLVGEPFSIHRKEITSERTRALAMQGKLAKKRALFSMDRMKRSSQRGFNELKHRASIYRKRASTLLVNYSGPASSSIQEIKEEDEQNIVAVEHDTKTEDTVDPSSLNQLAAAHTFAQGAKATSAAALEISDSPRAEVSDNVDESGVLNDDNRGPDAADATTGIGESVEAEDAAAELSSNNIPRTGAIAASGPIQVITTPPEHKQITPSASLENMEDEDLLSEKEQLLAQLARLQQEMERREGERQKAAAATNWSEFSTSSIAMLQRQKSDRDLKHFRSSVIPSNAPKKSIVQNLKERKSKRMGTKSYIDAKVRATKSKQFELDDSQSATPRGTHVRMHTMLPSAAQLERLISIEAEEDELREAEAVASGHQRRSAQASLNPMKPNNARISLATNNARVSAMLHRHSSMRDVRNQAQDGKFGANLSVPRISPRAARSNTTNVKRVRSNPVQRLEKGKLAVPSKPSRKSEMVSRQSNRRFKFKRLAEASQQSPATAPSRNDSFISSSIDENTES
jgi:hypothetical protein